MRESWPVIVDPPQRGIDNMKSDEALLNWVNNFPGRMTILRFYRWSVPTVSYGKHQRVEGVLDKANCCRLGLDWVQRPTGGRAVLHDDELTYSVISSDSGSFGSGSIGDSYQLIAKALVDGLKRVGVAVRTASRKSDSSSRGHGRERSPCFLSASRDELIVGNRKLVGSAQHRPKRSFLQHGSIPLRINYSLMSAALAVDPETLRQRIISVSEAAGRLVTFGTMIRGLKAGFEYRFGIQLRLNKFPENLRFL